MPSLRLPDGRIVTLGERTAGGSKNETRFGTLSDGQAVVVKVQRTHGRLADEEQALRFLQGHRVRVPRVVGSGLTDAGERFLVITREDGVRTRDTEGWRRFGSDVAQLATVPIDTAPLRRVGTAELVVDHRERLRAVMPLLKPATTAAIEDAIDHVTFASRLVLTHGDPGSGNYLYVSRDDPGILLDWETATISPFGLDAGRAVFIALLDLSKTGMPDQLAQAFVEGYRCELDGAVSLDDELLKSWVVIAGLQFIHGRYTQPLMAERTPQVAATVLDAYLQR